MKNQVEIVGYQTEWKIEKYNSSGDYDVKKPYEVSRFKGNLLLNEGITALQNLLIGAAEDAFNSTNAYLGVSTSTAAESATQTGLQGTNKTWKPMEATYPSIAGQVTTFRSVFGSGDANYSWDEFSIMNDSATGDNLNRKVSAQGVKAAGQTWTLDLSITWS